MGMYVNFIRMTTEQLAQATKDPEWAEQFVEDLYDFEADPPPEGIDADIEKSWEALDHLFAAAGVDFDIQMGGYTIAMDDGWYYNGWGVEEVAAGAKALKGTSFDALAEHSSPESLSESTVYPMRHLWDAEDFAMLRDDFERLQAFFVAAAESGHGAMMTFG